MPGYLLVNPRSGDDRPTADELCQEAEGRGIRVHVLAQGEDVGSAARKAGGGDPIGMAGGDGSLAAVAAAAIELDVPFVCIPFGTRNHFARDLELDRNDPLGMLAAFEGTERRVDVGRVGERLFLNNVSLGLYARLVHRREGHRRRREALAGIRALRLVAGERHGLHVRVDGTPMSGRIFLVSVNAYQLELFSLGERASLEEGELHLYVARGWLPRTWTELKRERFRIEARLPLLRGAIDGEPVTLETPLEFRIEPRALRVLVPPN